MAVAMIFDSHETLLTSLAGEYGGFEYTIDMVAVS